MLLLGCSNPPTMGMEDDWKNWMNLTPFLANDVCRLVVLDKDEFGIQKKLGVMSPSVGKFIAPMTACRTKAAQQRYYVNHRVEMNMQNICSKL